MGAHIFLVGEDNFQTCIERGIYGCVMPTREWNQAEVVAGILSIEPGDLVFFYVKNRGIYGLWKVVGTPFFDETPIWDNDSQTYPYRFSFKPTVNQFHKPVDLSDVFDLRDRGKIWAFDLNPVQQKNQYKITINEAHELLRLLLRNNLVREEIADISHPYMRPASSQDPEVDFSSSSGSKVRYEGWLNAWFIRSFAQGHLTEFFGDFNEFLNLVPTTFNKVMDIFLTHVTRIDSIDVLYKYTCIELKTDRAKIGDLAQLLRYEKWLTRRLAGGDLEMIQSVLVAHSFSSEILEYVTTRNRVEERAVQLISYRLIEESQEVRLSEAGVE